MTAINYVRDLPGGGVVAACGHCSQASPPPSIPMVMGVWQHEELSVSVQVVCRGSNGAIPSIGGGQPAT